MSVTAYPVILIDSATGSDTAASGAGPGTALTGTTAATDGGGTTVTLDAGTVTTGVAVDGSHVVYLSDATAGHRNFAAINAKAGSGGATPTVTVEQAFTGSLSGKSWAIGGKRASLTGGTSVRLCNNNAGNGDAMGGWVMQFASAHAESYSTNLDLYRSADVAVGPITIRGVAGYATRPVLTYTGSGFGIEGKTGVGGWVLQAFGLRNTGTGSHGMVLRGSSTAPAGYVLRDVKIYGTTNWSTQALYLGDQCVMHLEGCEFTNAPYSWDSSNETCVQMIGCHVHDMTSHGVRLLAGHGLLFGNLINANGGDGVRLGTSSGSFRAWEIVGNTIDGNTSDGIEIDAAGIGDAGSLILNNILTRNGGYGVNYSSGTATAAWLTANLARVLNNTFGSGGAANTSGAIAPTGVAVDSQTADPNYVGSGDFTPQNTALKGTAFPVLIP